MNRGISPLCLVLLLLLGCGSSDVPRATVSGTVSYQGEILKRGFIIFAPVQGVQGAPVQLNIVDGRYNSTDDQVDRRGVVIGENDVQILSEGTTGKKVTTPDGTTIEEIVNLIPEKYNEKTELRRTVKAGKNEFNFELD